MIKDLATEANAKEIRGNLIAWAFSAQQRGDMAAAESYLKRLREFNERSGA